MKFFILNILVSTLLFTGCEKVEQNGSKLTPAELEYLQNRARLDCINNSAKEYEDFYQTMNQDMMNMSRDDAWKFEFKKDNTVTNTKNIVVWKIDNTTNSAYFLVRVVSDSGVTLNKFYKVTTTINQDMLVDLQYKACSKLDKTTISFNSSTTTKTYNEDIVREDSDTRTEGVKLYTLKPTLPGLFGFLALKRTVKTLKNDDTVSATNVWEQVITSISPLPAQSTNLNDYSNKQFCMLTFTNASGSGSSAIPVTYPEEYKELCVSDVSQTVDANGDSVADFTPATDLAI